MEQRGGRNGLAWLGPFVSLGCERTFIKKKAIWVGDALLEHASSFLAGTKDKVWESSPVAAWLHGDHADLAHGEGLLVLSPCLLLLCVVLLGLVVGGMDPLSTPLELVCPMLSLFSPH